MAARPTTTKPAGKPLRRGAGQGTAQRAAASRRPARAPTAAALAPVPLRADARAAIDATVSGLGYEVVDIERAPRGLLRITIDRLPGQHYASGDGEFITVDDCELVTRQLQYALEVDGVAYERLEVSSPGLDRPLHTEAHYLRFVGAEVSLQLKLPFEGRKAFRGVLGRAGAAEVGTADAAGAAVADNGTAKPHWTLDFDDGKGVQQLGFELAEVREARLVPVVNFKGRKQVAGGNTGSAEGAAQDGGQDR